MWRFEGQSLILWAQNPDQGQLASMRTANGICDAWNEPAEPNSNWSWPDAREYFYIALTGRNMDGAIVLPDAADMTEKNIGMLTL